VRILIGGPADPIDPIDPTDPTDPTDPIGAPRAVARASG
jgi:hypothetical protein